MSRSAAKASERFSIVKVRFRNIFLANVNSSISIFPVFFTVTSECNQRIHKGDLVIVWNEPDKFFAYVTDQRIIRM